MTESCGWRSTSWTPVRVRERFNVQQHELKQGPYFDLSGDVPIVVCDDLSVDTRWPQWREFVRAESEIRTVMSVRLFVEATDFGAIMLFSRHRN